MVINYEKNKKYYFGPYKKIKRRSWIFTAAVIASGIFSAIAFSFELTLLFILLLAAACVSAALAALSFTNPDTVEKCSPSVPDRYLREFSKKKLVEQALASQEDKTKFEACEPLFFSGYYYNEIDCGMKIRTDEKGRSRSSNAEWTVFFVSSDDLLKYSRRSSLIYGMEVQTVTEKYPLKNIVGITADTEKTVIGGKRCVYGTLTLRLSDGKTAVCAADLAIPNAKESFEKLKNAIKK